MPRGRKIRRIDYNAKEMRELCNIKSRPTFNEQIKKLCKLYDFKVEDFKIDHSKDGDYYFPADFAELVALLLKHHSSYPLNRANAVSENIRATQIEEYNRLICDDVDNDIHDIFRKLIYTLPCHLQALKLGDMTTELVERLTLFLINITKLDHQEIGETLKWLCRALDEANYNLFRSSYFKNKVIESNIAFCENNFKEQDEVIYGTKNNEIETLENEIMKSNNSIDYAIAMIIKRIMNDTKELNAADKGTEFLTPDDNDILKVMGLKVTAVSDKSIDSSKINFAERDLYYRSVIGQYLNPGKYAMAESVINNYNDKIKNRKSIVDKIKDGSFREPGELSIDEKKKILEDNIRDMQEELDRISEDSFEDEVSGDELFNEMKSEYVKYCENIMNNSSKLNEAVDRFVGQVLINTLNSTDKM